MTLSDIILAALKEAEGGHLQVAEACRLERQAGLGGVTYKDWPIRIEPTKSAQHFVEHWIWRARMYADVPEDVFEGWLRTGVKLPRFSQEHIRRQAQNWRRAREKEARANSSISSDALELYRADIRDVGALKIGAATAIITDPPYPRHPFLDVDKVWAELIYFADRTLVDHGWLVTMTGELYLDEVMDQMWSATRGTDIHYRWTMALLTPGQTSGAMIAPAAPGLAKVTLNTFWKPILVFSKGRPQPWRGSDVYTSQPGNQEYHKWGQNVDVLREIVNNFSEPGGLVVDPFLGGGSTAVAAILEGRAVEGFDVDQLAVNAAVEHVGKATP